MSIHKSLRTNKNQKKKSVNKRLDRIKKLIKEGKMSKEDLKIYNLPKEKIKVYKLKKEKKEETKTETTNLGELNG